MNKVSNHGVTVRGKRRCMVCAASEDVRGYVAEAMQAGISTARIARECELRFDFLVSKDTVARHVHHVRALAALPGAVALLTGGDGGKGDGVDAPTCRGGADVTLPADPGEAVDEVLRMVMARGMAEIEAGGKVGASALLQAVDQYYRLHGRKADVATVAVRRLLGLEVTTPDGVVVRALTSDVDAGG